MSRSSSGRRDFLNPLKAIKAFREEASEAKIRVPTPDTETVNEFEDSCLLFVSKQAMACTFQIYFSPDNGDAIAEAAVEALELVEQLENQMTVYRSSPMTYLNEMAATEPIRVDAKLYQLLKTGRELFELTGGAFDMTAGLLTKTWGFFRKEGRVPNDSELADVLQCVGTNKLKFDDDNKTIAFEQAELEVNLGAIGKGYAIDRAAEFLIDNGVDNFLIHGGQSSVLAHGVRWQHAESEEQSAKTTPPIKSEPWKVGLRHPTHVENRIAEIGLSDRALGTSGTGRQSFYHKGKRYGHIIDPRTGNPCDGVYSATALAPTAAQADALATAFYVMGADAAIRLCEGNPQYACVMIVPSKSQGVAIKTHGLRENEIRFLSNDT